MQKVLRKGSLYRGNIIVCKSSLEGLKKNIMSFYVSRLVVHYTTSSGTEAAEVFIVVITERTKLSENNAYCLWKGQRFSSGYINIVNANCDICFQAAI